MINKIKRINFNKFTTNKRLIIISSFIMLVFLLTLLSYTFSAFTNRKENQIANIKVAGMEYSLAVNGIPGTVINATKNDTTKSNLIITSLNNVDSKYELIYKVCSDSSCTNFINKPEGLNIQYSSRTIDPITNVIAPQESKQIRIITTNNTSNNYYIKLDINAGYIHNTLALENLITTEYNEEDIIIAATINGEVSTTFPSTNDYVGNVTCTTNNAESNATGTVNWNGNKWILNVTGVDSGRTICNVYFDLPLRNKIIAQGEGIDKIIARGTPNFDEINGTSSIYATDDEYGTSYYYRGLKDELSNNLIWGGFQWKIVRINGDGSVRLIYNGTEAQFNSNSAVNSTGITTRIGTGVWNTYSNDAKYVGYMYGGVNGTPSTMRNGTTSAAATYNQTDSNAKTQLDNWYIANIKDKPFETDVIDNLFCNDKQLQSEVGGSSTGTGFGNSDTDYATRHRLSTNKNPTLKCTLKNDRFTVNDSSLGNAILTYPVGLLTADELSMAGLKRSTSNNSNYLYTNQTYWLFSPYNYYYGAGVWHVHSDGNLNFGLVDSSSRGLRSVVSISGDISVTGDGSSTNPYKAV